MNSPSQLAKHFKEVYHGGNWTWSNLKDMLADVSWQEATTKLNSFNTIAALVYHIDYFVIAVNNVLKGTPLNSKDELSFNHPPISSQEDWEKLLKSVWENGDRFVQLVEALPDQKLEEIFVKEKYGIYYRNLLGVIEHTHYHLGQIAIIKKLVKSKGVSTHP